MKTRLALATGLALIGSAGAAASTSGDSYPAAHVYEVSAITVEASGLDPADTYGLAFRFVPDDGSRGFQGGTSGLGENGDWTFYIQTGLLSHGKPGTATLWIYDATDATYSEPVNAGGTTYITQHLP